MNVNEKKSPKRMLRATAISLGLWFLMIGCSGELPTPPDGEKNLEAQKLNVKTPEGIEVLSKINRIQINWPANDDVKTYNLRWSNAGDMDEKFEVVEDVVSPYVHLELDGKKTYFYVLEAVGKDGTKKASEQFSSTPLELSATELQFEASVSSITVSWNLMSGADGYDLYWNTSGSEKVEESTLVPDIKPPYKHENLDAGKAYYYFVMSRNAEEQMQAKSAVKKSAVLNFIAPVVTAVSYFTEIKLTWQDVAGASNYEVFRGDSTGDLSNKVSVQTNNYTYVNLSLDRVYYFTVRAINKESGKTKQSDEVVTKTLKVPVFTIQPGTGKIKLSVSVGDNFGTGAKYKMFWTNSDNGSGVITDNIGIDFEHTGLANTLDYYYRLEVISSDGLRSSSSAIYGPTRPN